MGEMEYSKEELLAMSPIEFRNIVREHAWTTGTFAGVCRGYAQANLAIVPRDMAFEFLLFCTRNPGPCPVIDVTEPGNPHPSEAIAKEADLRTDLPKYRVFKSGELVDEPTDIIKYWRDDLVAFLLGCSLSFDWLLEAANVEAQLVGVFTTNIPCKPAGRFSGPLVVSCRIVKNAYDAIRATQISSRCPAVHGAPVHIGDSTVIGIKDFYHPDIWSVESIPRMQPNEIALYWPCGVTPQKIAMETKPPLMITHFPAHMFITDRLSEELSIL
jgi:uncharacterized protein YcsI (UPF0317 family)